MFSAIVEKDSFYDIEGIESRVTSFVVEAPRMILAEIVTHRSNSNNSDSLEISWSENTTTKEISKNSSSSRAIPFSKMMEKIRTDHFNPIWTINQKGMQGESLKDQNIKLEADRVWDCARDAMCFYAKQLSDLGIHKQNCNRLLEPFSWTKQILTSSNWDNFFALRCHEAAQPEFRKLARMMYLAREKSIPKKLCINKWHLPFISDEESKDFEWHGHSENIPDLIKFSVARCAWVSYANSDKKATPEDMFRTYDLLLKEIPVHASPSEHQVTPCPNIPHRFRSNISGWIQFRKLINQENVLKYKPSLEELNSWSKDFV